MTMLRVLTGENTFFLFNLSIAMTIFFPFKYALLSLSFVELYENRIKSNGQQLSGDQKCFSRKMSYPY